jgi:predicted aldo/keto reductase-like oxidoreductase
MEYRKIPKGTDKVSTIGIGGAHLHEISPEEMQRLVDYSLEQGVNLVDTAISYPEALDKLGPALKGQRDKVLYQLHLGLTFPNGQYLRTRKLDQVQKGFEAQLDKLGIDYADIAFIHYVDEEKDFEEVFSSGVFDYARKLKKDGTIRYLGFASHNVDICNRFIETGEVDLCMFSLNAAYDLDPVSNVPFEELDMIGQDQLTVSQERAKFYQECEKRGIGIQVMKPYGGGILLNPGTSPFERVMTIYQCLQYALDRPAVLSCLLGVRSRADMEDAIGFYSSSKEQRDYSFIAGMQHKDMRGTCVYCNHCLPCPVNIDIGAVHKYLDLFLAGDQLAKEHYRSLSQRAKDCIECGSCEKSCPFQVNVRDKMQNAVKVLEN